MQINEVKLEDWPDRYFRIELKVSNVCNYQCWYCFPDSNTGTYKWPNYDLLVTNLEHLLNHYGNKKYHFALIGGELSHWPKFINFIKHFKERYDCIFTITTNGSKKLAWWAEAASYLDLVSISHHREYSDLDHNRTLLDMLYEKDVLCNVQVMMDPTAWEQSIEAIEYYKQSKHSWSIRRSYIMSDVPYTSEQEEIISEGNARNSDVDWFVRTNKTFKSNVLVIDDNNHLHKFRDNELVMRHLNNFNGWECTLGVHWLAVMYDGSISGLCGNKLFGSDETYNIYDVDFINKFNPVITSTICKQTVCQCQFETNMPKHKLSTTPKVIPIYAT